MSSPISKILPAMNPRSENFPALRSFLSHLDELRSRLIKSLFVFILTSSVCYSFAENFLRSIIKPVRQVVFTSPAEGFVAVVSVTLFLGFVTAAPFIAFQLWAFISEALSVTEKKYVLIFGPLSLFLFFAGIAFGYFLIVPISLGFLLSYSSSWMVPMIRISEYISFIGNFVLAFGIVFELPLVLVFLAKIGIASPEFLRQKRRYAIVFIFILSAILTPPDCASLFLMAIPLVGLYELGIFLAQMVYRERL